MSNKPDLDKSLETVDKVVRKKTGSLAPPKPQNLAAQLAPGAFKKAVQPAAIEDAIEHPLACKFAMLGSGQGGSKLASSLWGLGYRRVGLFNTTANDWADVDKDIPQLSLDIGGAAKDTSLARDALLGRDEEVWDLFTRAWGTSFDRALITASLGGGTGSGTVWPLIRQARKYMEQHKLTPKVGAIVSLPTLGDGSVMARNAVIAFKELIDNSVSPLIVVDNQKVNEIYNPGAKALHPRANELVTRLFHLFNKLAAQRSQYVTFDQAEFGQLLDGGIVVMGCADIDVPALRSPADISAAIREQLANNVLADADLKTAHSAACIFVGSDDVLDLSTAYFDAGFTTLDRIVGANRPDLAEKPTLIHHGLYADEDASAEKSLQCYTMVSGLDVPATRLRELAKKAGLFAVNNKTAPAGARHLNVD